MTLGTVADEVSTDEKQVTRWATMSSDLKYRYVLGRNWEPKARYADLLGFVMLNPSTADAEVNDPTIRKCMYYARRWDYAGIVVVNMFGWRATDPKDLLGRNFHELIGPDNDQHLMTSLLDCREVICAWGANAQRFPVRDRHLRSLLRPMRHRVRVLKLTKEGHPAHPLYLPNSIVSQPWSTL